MGTGFCQYGEVRGRKGTAQAAVRATRSSTLSRIGKTASMLGSSIVPGSVIARTTRAGQTIRFEARVPTRPTTARRIHSSWCCQAVGETATATQPVTATASRSWPSLA
ncbi:hypothetical protein GCM10009612_42800 [Streptomyces beijiangensis]